MGSRRHTICSSRSSHVSILSVRKGSAEKAAKTVTIVEPEYIQEKRLGQERNSILEKRLTVEELVRTQIRRRAREFNVWRKNYQYERNFRRLRDLILYALLLWLVLAITRASLCHSHNPHCESFWHECLISGMLSLFVSSGHERTPM